MKNWMLLRILSILDWLAAKVRAKVGDACHLTPTTGCHVWTNRSAPTIRRANLAHFFAAKISGPDPHHRRGQRRGFRVGSTFA